MNVWIFEELRSWEDIWATDNMTWWMDIMDRSSNAHVFYHPALVRAWVETYMPIRNLTPIFLRLRDEEGNEGLFPLVLWQKNWKNVFMRSIVPIGYSDFDYHDPIFLYPPKDLQSFWRQLLSFLKQHYRFDEICLDGITEAMLPR